MHVAPARPGHCLIDFVRENEEEYAKDKGLTMVAARQLWWLGLPKEVLWGDVVLVENTIQVAKPLEHVVPGVATPTHLNFAWLP